MKINIGQFLWKVIVGIHEEVFIRSPVYFLKNLKWKNYSTGEAIRDAFIIIGCILAILLLDFLAIYGIYKLLHWLVIVIRTKEIRKKVVEGVIIEKKHEEIYIRYYKYEKYNVYVKYDGLEAVFDNEKLYQKTKKNNKITLLLVERIDRKGRVIKRTLKLPK